MSSTVETAIDDPPLPRRRSGRGAGRPASTHRGHALAREGDRRRSVAGRAARDDPGARALLGDGLRLAQVRGEAERPAAVHHRDRRAGHPLHPRSLEARRRAAAHRQSRMARLDHRAAEDHRSAHRSHGTRRERSGRLPRGDSVDAGLRVLGQADEHRLGPRAHGPSLGRADEAPRLHPLRRPGRRLGCVRRRPDGLAGTRGIARHPHQHARHRSSRRRQGSPGRRPAAIRSLGRGTTRLRAAGQDVQAGRLRQVDGGRARRPCTASRIHPSAWPPGCSTTTMPTASRPRRSPRL